MPFFTRRASSPLCPCPSLRIAPLHRPASLLNLPRPTTFLLPGRRRFSLPRLITLFNPKPTRLLSLHRPTALLLPSRTERMRPRMKVELKSKGKKKKDVSDSDF